MINGTLGRSGEPHHAIAIFRKTSFGVFLVLCLLLIGLLFVGLNANAESSYTSKPTPLTAWENNIQTELYGTDFNHINDLEKYTTGAGMITVAGGHMEISSTVNQNALALTRDIDIHDLTLREQFDFPMYSAETEFDSMGSVYSGDFIVMSNVQVCIYATDEFYDPELDYYSLVAWSPWYWDPVLETSYFELAQLTPGNYQHTIYVEVYANQMHNGRIGYYDIYVDGYLAIEKFPVTDSYQMLEGFKFGDQYTDWCSGAGRWDYFWVKGLSGATYFENFNDENIHDWSDFYADEDVYWTTRGLPNEMLWVNTVNPVWRAWAKTQYIDYAPSSSWTVSMDFYGEYVGDPGYFELAFNGQFKVIVTESKLYYVTTGDVLNYVMDLQNNRWYFMELVRTGAYTYTIQVDHSWMAENCNFYSTSEVYPAIRLGDTSLDLSCSMYVDNIKMVLSDGVSPDADQDLLGDNFENGWFNGQWGPMIIAWSEDFEYDYAFDLEELGWDDRLSRATDDGGLGDDHKWEVGPPTPNYYGMQLDDPKHGFMDTPPYPYEPQWGNVLGTAIDDDINVDFAYDYIDSPPFIVGMHSRLVFWHWFDFQEPADGGQILYSINGGSFMTLGSYPNFYNIDLIPWLGGPAFTGSSGGWERAEVEIPPVEMEWELRIRFLYATDDMISIYPGWYIDNIRVYSTTWPGMDNSDHDFSESWVQDRLGGPASAHYLLDGEEYHYLGTNPIRRDSDGDCIYDNVEIFHVDLQRNDLPGDNSGPAGQTGTRADPHTRDIYIEMDYMATLKPPKSEYRPSVTKFKSHDIILHVVYDDEAQYVGMITEGEALDMYSTHMTANRVNIFYYCFVAAFCGEGGGLTPLFGVTDSGGGSYRFALFYGYISSMGSHFYKHMSHELGHCLGLHHYRKDIGNYIWEDEISPPRTCMTSGHGSTAEYLGEESDTLYGWKEKEEDDYTYSRFGGWEYAYTQVPYVSPKCGLYHGGILNAP